jgi:hypothetical protein
VLVEAGHFLQDYGCESASNRRETHQDGRFDIVDDIGKLLDLFAGIVIAREVNFVIGKLVATVVGYQTLCRGTLG